MNAEASEAAAPPPPAPTAAGWSPLIIVAGVLTVFGASIVVAMVIALVAPNLDEETFELIVQAVFALALFAVPPLLIARGSNLLAAGTRLGLRGFKLAQGLGWTLAAYGGFFVFLIAYGLIVQPDPQQIIEEIEQQRETLKLVALGILVILAAPISEEVFFRGFLFGGLRGRMSFWPAAILSGLLFGLVHLPGGALQVPPLAVFGVLLAWLYERTGSLGPPIVMHMIQNTISFSYTLSA